MRQSLLFQLLLCFRLVTLEKKIAKKKGKRFFFLNNVRQRVDVSWPLPTYEEAESLALGKMSLSQIDDVDLVCKVHEPPWVSSPHRRDRVSECSLRSLFATLVSFLNKLNSLLTLNASTASKLLTAQGFPGAGA